MRFDMEAARRTAAFNQRQNDIAEGDAGLLAALRRKGILADESFVGFYRLASAAHGRKAASAQRFAKAMHHKPARLIADAKRAMDLMGRYAFLGSGEQEQRGKPFGQRDFAALENGFNG